MKVLVIGHKGQLGTELLHCLENGRSEIGPLPACFRGAEIEGVDIDTLDIADKAACENYLIASRPDIVINCAAYTNVDGCESHPEEAYQGNAIGARNLAIAAEQIGAKLLHLSTDYVFCGDEPSPRREYDRTNPVSIYGKTKLAGEEFVRSFCSRWFIVRTAWLYGYYGKNFVKTIVKKARETGQLRVVNDQFGCPTNAADLAHQILKIAATDGYGVYHCTGNGQCSWFDFAQKIVSLAGIDAVVSPCASGDYPSPTKRPAYSVLDHMMLRITVGDDMRDWEDALKDYFTKWKEETI
jgi:dTDP-4-dehydrorhamnose reductase